jgi:predicted acyltransferase
MVSYSHTYYYTCDLFRSLQKMTEFDTWWKKMRKWLEALIIPGIVALVIFLFALLIGVMLADFGFIELSWSWPFIK